MFFQEMMLSLMKTQYPIVESLSIVDPTQSSSQYPKLWVPFIYVQQTLSWSLFEVPLDVDDIIPIINPMILHT